MVNDLFIFTVALLLVIKGATFSTRYAARLADSLRLSKYAVAFIFIAVVGVLPEAFISISSALKGIPSFGLSVIFGSNIADLTLLFAVIIFLTRHEIKVESNIIRHEIFPFLMLLPIVLGLDGHYSRLDGAALIIAGAIFYYVSFRDGVDGSIPAGDGHKIKNLFLLLFSMAVLLVGAHFTVSSVTSIAGYIGISPVLIGMFVVGLGTTMPELFFSIKSIKKQDDSLAIGDILGTVLTDATILVGLMALIIPFTFPKRIIYVTGFFMVAAAFILFHCMRTGRKLSKKEAFMLLTFWVLFAAVEFIVNQ